MKSKLNLLNSYNKDLSLQLPQAPISTVNTMYTRALLTTSAFVLLYGLIGQQHSTDAQWTGNRGSSLLGGGESAEAGGGSAQGGMMEMPSWMTFLRDFLRARMQEWRREQRRLQQQQTTTTTPPPPPPVLFPLDPWFGGPLARSTQDVLPGEISSYGN